MDSANELNRPQTPPAPPAPSAPPSAPPSASDSASDSTTRCSTRDQRLQAQTLYDAGLTYTQIRTQLGLTLRKIQYAVSHRLTESYLLELIESMPARCRAVIDANRMHTR
jgi:hypothetical protein